MDNSVNPNGKKDITKQEVPNNNGKKSNIGIIALLVIIIVGLVGYLVYDKVLSNKDDDNEEKKDENIVENNNDINKDRQLSNEESKGLEIYKYFYGEDHGTGPFKWEATDEFVVKTNMCSQNDLDNDFSSGYKVDKFNLIHELKFQ